MWRAALITALVCIFSWQLSSANPTQTLNQELIPMDYEDDDGSGDKDDCQGVSCTLKGEKGDPGRDGPAGPQGEKGDLGPVGPAGPIGPQGTPGEIGPPGFCDASLCVGPPEPRPPGEKGQKGESGKDGSDGAPGEMGDQGSPGRKGIPGLPGEPGMKGMNGDPGMKGEPGMQGPSGDPGTPGSDGGPGEQGPPGDSGDPGEAGRKGVPGMKGEKGEPGSTVDIIPRVDSETCNETLQGDIRFDPNTKQLYFCNGTEWVCVQTTTCPDPPREPPSCPSPIGPVGVGNCWYQVFVQNVTQATQDAADIVLVVDESGSMTREQDWLLVMVPFLEETLVENGVGDGDVKNRYCLIGYGSFGNLRPGHFRLVDGEPCFTADRFADAQRLLIAAGLREDGYQAIKFGLDNIPFRDSPFIAKNVILVTDEGRTVIPEGEDITREGIQAELRENDILLNVVVLADYELVNDTMDRTVIGVDARGVSLILEPDGKFSETNESVHVTKAEKNTAADYVDLAVSLGGASWALRILRESAVNRNEDIQESFTSALTQIKLREIRAVIESCRKCVCVAGVGDDPPTASCTIANDEQFCRCVVENNGDDSTCESGLPDPTEDDRVMGGLVPTGNSISMIPRSPDFMFLNSETMNP